MFDMPSTLILAGRDRVKFTVQTDKQAVIGLSESTLGESNMYKIVIRTEPNKKSEVERCETRGPDGFQCESWIPPVNTTGVLDPSQPRGFWIEWGITPATRGLIKVGELGSTPFMNRTTPDPSPIAIIYLGYATGPSCGESTWNFCGEFYCLLVLRFCR
ncbi:uncharacterized protein LOC119744963 [Patiria miniata]|uniref:Farnesoic acid O-methyl transferase domain-containing protein n=1 Tax=Patiria miniata TaxID=46514 RepID=A0A914BLX0_PATMI|nr:uncharacterized protein LOC119744963 [Patiria miniata]